MDKTDTDLKTGSGQQEGVASPIDAMANELKPPDGNESKRPPSTYIVHRASEYIQTILTLIGALAGAGVFIYTLFFTNSFKKDTTLVLDKEIYDLRSAVEKQMANQDSLVEQIKKYQEILSSLSNIPKEDAIYLQLKQMANDVSELKSREEKLEAVILNNPAKALEMPLIERDVENIKVAEQTNLATMKDSVDRIYDLNKWLLGAMAVGIVTLAISNFLRSTDKS